MRSGLLSGLSAADGRQPAGQRGPAAGGVGDQRGLYYRVGFWEVTRDEPLIKAKTAGR